MQQFIIRMMEEKGVPIAALRFVPGFGEQVSKLLYGDPYEAHTFFADMLYNVQQLLDQDHDHDPVILARKQEYAEAEERAAIRRTAKDYNTTLLEQYTGTRYNFATGSTEPSASGSFNGSGSDGIREINTTGSFTQAIPDSLPDLTRVDSGQ